MTKMPALKSDFVLYLMDDCGEKRLARGAAKCGRVSPYVVGPGLRSVPTISRSSELTSVPGIPDYVAMKGRIGT